MNWNKWVRQSHRWLSIAGGRHRQLRRRGAEEYTGWVGLFALLPMALLPVTGLNLFVLPYAVKWGSGRRTG